MKILSLSVLLLLIGCTVTPVLKPYEVKTIVTVPCIEEKDLPPRPSYVSDEEMIKDVVLDKNGKLTSGGYEFVYYLYFEHDVRQDYETKLEAVLAACVKK